MSTSAHLLLSVRNRNRSVCLELYLEWPSTTTDLLVQRVGIVLPSPLLADRAKTLYNAELDIQKRVTYLLDADAAALDVLLEPLQLAELTRENTLDFLTDASSAGWTCYYSCLTAPDGKTTMARSQRRIAYAPQVASRQPEPEPEPEPRVDAFYAQLSTLPAGTIVPYYRGRKFEVYYENASSHPLLRTWDSGVGHWVYATADTLHLDAWDWLNIELPQHCQETGFPCLTPGQQSEQQHRAQSTAGTWHSFGRRIGDQCRRFFGG